MIRTDWRKLNLQARILTAATLGLVTLVGLASLGACDGAPAPKINKSARDAGPVETDAISVGIDANQPSTLVESEVYDGTLEEDFDAGDGKD